MMLFNTIPKHECIAHNIFPMSNFDEYEYIHYNNTCLVIIDDDEGIH